MTVHDLLAYGEYCLRDDKEYWAQMDKLKKDIDQFIYRHNKIMAATIIRLAVMMVTEQNDSKCSDCTGGYCEEECDGLAHTFSPCVGCNGGICEICTEGKDNDEE